MTDCIAQLSRAILYEGYLLYPYRLSSLKNRQRWNFGVLFPPNFSEAEASRMQTECLLEGNLDTTISAKVQFLQYDSVCTVEREVQTGKHHLAALIQARVEIPFSFPNLRGRLTISAAEVAPNAFRFTLVIENQTPFAGCDREHALRHALLSTQTLVHVNGGAFHSMIDPPDSLATARERCRNIGTWPVLIGQPGQRDWILSAPIILYDYPAIAPQSPTDLFDNTEIDEILTLRIQTLTDEEKFEAMRADVRAGDLLARADSLPAGKLQKLHGTLRRGADALRPGDQVVIKPNRRADILDIALAGRIGTVCSIEQDFENNAYACVVMNDDPGKDFGAAGQPGHRFFFFLDEVEKI